MKVTRILAALLLVAVLAGAANAQTVRLSWNTCDPVVQDQVFGLPGVYNLVLSAVGFPAIAYSGHDTEVDVFTNGPLPDAWRFDDLGCQTGTQVAYVTSGLTKACPAFQGPAPLGIQAYLWEQYYQGQASIRLANTFDAFTPLSSLTRYTLFQVRFDHTYTVVGPTTPGVDCGGGGQGVGLRIKQSQVLETVSGNLPTLGYNGAENYATWNGGPVVATVPSTWGKLKGLYR